MMTEYRATLGRWIQCLFYPGLACLGTGIVLGTPTPSVMTEVLARVGGVTMGIVLGLLIAKALTHPRRQTHGPAPTRF